MPQGWSTVAGAHATDQELMRQVEAAIHARDIPTALALARAALDQGVQHPVLYDLRAHWHEQNNRDEEALDDLRRASKLAPSDPRLHNSISKCLLSLDRPQEALAASNRALELEPRFALAHYYKGCALEVSAQLAAARQAFERAVQLNPKLADAYARLASLAARRSEWDRARVAAAEALSLDPDNHLAATTTASVDLAQGNLDGLDIRLKPLATSQTATAQQRAGALSLLGNVLDRQNRVHEAFAAYQAATEELKAFYGGKFGSPSEQSGPVIVERLIRHLNSISVAPVQPSTKPLRAPSDTSAGLVFLVGYFRTGTTLLGQILARHSVVTTLEERPVLIDSIRDFSVPAQGMAMLASLNEQQALFYRELYWKRVRELGGGIDGRLVVDKMPLNSINLPVIAKLFPDAKIIFAIRDPRDVVFSCFRRLLTVTHFSFENLTLERAARFYGSVMELSELSFRKLPLNVHRIRNEDVVADFDGQISALCKFLEIEWNPEMRDFASESKKRFIATPSATQVARGLNSDGIGQWRRYSEELAPVLPILQPWVEKFGYAAD